MSTLKVNKLRDTAGSADAITLDPNGGAVLAGVTTVTSVKVGAAVTISESGIEASGIGITCANINGTQIGGRRNIIINGAMNVAQRGTSSTSDGYATVDRFVLNFDNISNSPTQAQVDVTSGTTPYTLGFRKAFKITNGDQTIGADDRLRLLYKVEAQDIANSGWNYTSTSSYITFSFWIKSSVAQNFFVRFETKDGTGQNYVIETGSLSADTWTKVTKTISGNSNLQFDNNNAEGLLIDFAPFYGTNFTGTRPLNAWAAYDGATRFPDFTTTWFDTNDSTLEITGVQLEVGPQATAFEHRSYGEELSLCQRYYYKHCEGNSQDIATGAYYTANLCAFSVKFPVSMRAAPTLDYVSSSDAYTIYSNGGSDPFTSMSIVRAHINSAAHDTSTGTSGTQGHGAILATATSSGYLAYTAEL